ncbi:MAG: phosphoribosylformylglycinamidine cyclo-ligase, partial [Eubacterium sp.]|nr:phosphoribosylformylglycinamidine cyclo-ligase [Eubacterium sp.]
YNTYNMGIGMVLAVRPDDVAKTMQAVREAGEYPYQIGHIRAGEKGVKLI